MLRSAHPHKGHVQAAAGPRRTPMRRECTASRSHTPAHQLRRAPTAAAAWRPQRLTRRTAVLPHAHLHSDSGGAGEPRHGQLKVLVVGANPAGLAAAVSLAQQAGCAGEVHDSRPDPRGDKHADNSSTLVALGRRGLEALSSLHLPAPADGSGGHAVATITPGSSSSSNSSDASGSSIAGLWTPGSANVGVLTDPASSSQGPSQPGMTQLPVDPLPGLTLLQGMVVVGPRGQRREQYSRPASRSKPKGSAVTGDMTAGVAAIDELSLTTTLLSAAAALGQHTSSTDTRQPQLVLPGSQAATAGATGVAAGGALRPKGTTPIPQGPTSAEAAQEAALPAVVPAPGTASAAAPTAPLAGGIVLGGSGGAVAGAGGSVEVHYGSHLSLMDAANKQATFMGAGGAATIVPYDLCIAADASAGGHLVVSALQGLQDRAAAHTHPSQLQQQQHSLHFSGSTGVAEQEYRAWQDMPHEPELAAVLGQGASTVSSTGSAGMSRTPQQGWLLVWTGPGSQQATHPGLSSAGAGATAMLPGAPSCTVMAWPSRGGGTWSGCVYTHPQVLEALRSQSDFEELLSSVSAPTGPAGSSTVARLPALWVKGIAAQLRRGDRTGRVAAPVLPPPHHLSAPSAGLVALTPAAVPSDSPQLLHPGVSLGLAEASHLAALIAQGMAAAGAASNTAGGVGTDVKQAVQQGLERFDEGHAPEAQALHKLLAQLSWLRHPYSPAAAAAAGAAPFGTLAWLGAAAGAPRVGLALQWKCLLAILPVVAAVQRVLLYKLGLGRPEGTPAAAAGSPNKQGAPDASYRQPPAAGAVSTSLDSGVHVDGSNRSSSVAGASAQGRIEAAALSAVTAAVSRSPAAAAYQLSDVADGVEPCGRSFASFLHTTDLPPSSIWRLLQVAPLIASVLWGALFWAAAQAVRWGMWALRASGWAQSGVA